MGPENEANHGQALPRERRSLREGWPGFLMVMGLEGFGRWMLDCGPQQSNPHPEVRRQSRSLEGRGLRAWGGSPRRMLRGSLRSHLSMRAVSAATHPARNEGGMVKRSWMNACRRMPYAGCNAATLIHHPEPVEGEVPRRGLEGRGLRAWGGSARRMLRGFVLRPKHLSMRMEGVASLAFERAAGVTVAPYRKVRLRRSPPSGLPAISPTRREIGKRRPLGHLCRCG